MNVFTHNTPARPDCTNIRFIRTEAPLSALTDLSDDWHHMDLNGDTVEDWEMLADQPLPKTEGADLIGSYFVNVDGEFVRVEKWGSL